MGIVCKKFSNQTFETFYVFLVLASMIRLQLLDDINEETNNKEDEALATNDGEVLETADDKMQDEETADDGTEKNGSIPGSKYFEGKLRKFW